jgi:hypothetical protein
MRRDYDERTGRPLTDGRDLITGLSDDELEAEVTIAFAEPGRRAHRLDELLLERTRRRDLSSPELVWQ